jgi:hypothetical protein
VSSEDNPDRLNPPADPAVQKTQREFVWYGVQQAGRVVLVLALVAAVSVWVLQLAP